MVRLGPVMTHEHLAHQHLHIIGRIEPEATSSSLMDQCSRHVIPPAIQVDLTNQQAHDLAVGLDVLCRKVLTCQRLGTISPHNRSEVVDPH
jgi:hypothetical protein